MRVAQHPQVSLFAETRLRCPLDDELSRLDAPHHLVKVPASTDIVYTVPSGIEDLHPICKSEIIQDLAEVRRQAPGHVAVDRNGEVDADLQVGA